MSLLSVEHRDFDVLCRGKSRWTPARQRLSNCFTRRIHVPKPLLSQICHYSHFVATFIHLGYIVLAYRHYVNISCGPSFSLTRFFCPLCNLELWVCQNMEGFMYAATNTCGQGSGRTYSRLLLFRLTRLFFSSQLPCQKLLW